MFYVKKSNILKTLRQSGHCKCFYINRRFNIVFILGMESKLEVIRLYPQYNMNDRRKQSMPVPQERRSMEQNTQTIPANNVKADEYFVDPNLRKDITEIKGLFKPFETANTKQDSYSGEDVTACVSSAVPFLRRFDAVKDAATNHEYLKAAGKAFLLL